MESFNTAGSLWARAAMLLGEIVADPFASPLVTTLARVCTLQWRTRANGDWENTERVYELELAEEPDFAPETGWWNWVWDWSAAGPIQGGPQDDDLRRQAARDVRDWVLALLRPDLTINLNTLSSTTPTALSQGSGIPATNFWEFKLWGEMRHWLPTFPAWAAEPTSFHGVLDFIGWGRIVHYSPGGDPEVPYYWHEFKAPWEMPVADTPYWQLHTTMVRSDNLEDIAALHILAERMNEAAAVGGALQDGKRQVVNLTGASVELEPKEWTLQSACRRVAQGVNAYASVGLMYKSPSGASLMADGGALFHAPKGRRR